MLSASSERSSEWRRRMKGTKLHNCVWLFKLCRSEGETEVADFRNAMTSDAAVCAVRSVETESPLALKLQCHIQ